MVNVQSKFMSQRNENDMVFKELNILDDDAKVFKLIGPVLLKQDLDEAKTNVEKRLQYINDEMYPLLISMCTSFYNPCAVPLPACNLRRLCHASCIVHFMHCAFLVWQRGFIAPQPRWPQSRCT